MSKHKNKCHANRPMHIQIQYIASSELDRRSYSVRSPNLASLVQEHRLQADPLQNATLWRWSTCKLFRSTSVTCMQVILCVQYACIESLLLSATRRHTARWPTLRSTGNIKTDHWNVRPRFRHCQSLVVILIVKASISVSVSTSTTKS